MFKRDSKKRLMKEKKKNIENNSYKFRISRKSYWVFYLMILFVIGYLLYIFFTGLNINQYAFGFALIFVLGAVKLTEVHRLNYLYKLTPTSLVYSQGIISKSIKNVDYYAISDVEVHQSLIQRILNYGTVNVKLFSTDSMTSIKNINDPEAFAQLLDEIIDKKRQRK